MERPCCKTYYIGIDQATQWFLKAFIFEGESIIKEFDIDSNISGDFVANLLDRQPTFSAQRINGRSWQTWSISQKEFNRIEELVKLYPQVQKYNNLLKWE